MTLIAHRGLVTWLFRRLIGPFVVGAIVCTALLLAWVTVTTGQRSIGFFDAKFATLIVLPFEAFGLALFLPVALALRRGGLTGSYLAPLLALMGAAIGLLVASPLMFSETPRLSELALPAVFGLVSALVWFSMNRDAFRRDA